MSGWQKAMHSGFRFHFCGMPWDMGSLLLELVFEWREFMVLLAIAFAQSLVN